MDFIVKLEEDEKSGSDIGKKWNWELEDKEVTIMFVKQKSLAIKKLIGSLFYLPIDCGFTMKVEFCLYF